MFFKPKNKLKLMSICLGPFKQHPGYQFKVQLSSYERSSLPRRYTQVVLTNKLLKEHYVVIVFTEELAITQDIKVRVTNVKLNVPHQIAFYYWLNPQFVMQGVGKVQQKVVAEREALNFSHFMMHDQVKRPYQYRIYDDYDITVQGSSPLFAEMGHADQEPPKTKSEKKLRLAKDQLERLSKHFIDEMNAHDERSLAKLRERKDA